MWQQYLTESNPYFYEAVFALLLLAGLAMPISADLVLLTCGYIAFKGGARIEILIPCALAGILLSDTIMFQLGKKYGLSLARLWPLKKVMTPERIDRARAGFQEQGYRVVFAARFMPGIRTAFMFTSGLMRLSYPRFIAHDLAGAAIVVPLTLLSVAWVAGNLDALSPVLKQIQWLVLTLVGIFSLAVWRRKRSKKMREPR